MPCSRRSADYNARFAKAPANHKDLHRPLRAGDDLDDAFAWKEERTLSRALTLQSDKFLFILEPSDQAKAAIGKRVTVVDYPDDRHCLCQSSQAKGRVERANKTLQDRLVKELRLQRISTIAAGNKLLPGFMADYNARLRKEPRNSKDLHRPLLVGDDLTDVFTWREERTVSNSLTLHYDKVVFLLEPNEITRELRRKR